jgi:hypothetical protein
MSPDDPHATDTDGGAAIEQAAFSIRMIGAEAILIALVALEIERGHGPRLTALLQEAQSFLKR